MTDLAKLKALAEAANAVTGDVNVEMVLVGESGSNQAEIDAVTSFLAATKPAAVLALIAENERIKARLCVCRDCGGQGEIYSGHSSYQGYNQPPEPDMDACGTCGGDGVLGPLEDFESLAAERDQLKAECEGLRVDAERLNWLDGRSRPIVEGHCMANPEGELTGYDWAVFGQCSTVREAIDDAMTKQPDQQPPESLT